MHFTSINKNSSIPTIEILIEKLAVKGAETESKPEQGDGSQTETGPSESGENITSNE